MSSKRHRDKDERVQIGLAGIVDDQCLKLVVGGTSYSLTDIIYEPDSTLATLVFDERLRMQVDQLDVLAFVMGSPPVLPAGPE
jgi:hypothetical protein